jgi:hypothetical protein
LKPHTNTDASTGARPVDAPLALTIILPETIANDAREAGMEMTPAVCAVAQALELGAVFRAPMFPDAIVMLAKRFDHDVTDADALKAIETLDAAGVIEQVPSLAVPAEATT